MIAECVNQLALRLLQLFALSEDGALQQPDGVCCQGSISEIIVVVQGLIHSIVRAVAPTLPVVQAAEWH